jgi:hypothetical protein
MKVMSENFLRLCRGHIGTEIEHLFLVVTYLVTDSTSQNISRVQKMTVTRAIYFGFPCYFVRLIVP